LPSGDSRLSEHRFQRPLSWRLLRSLRHPRREPELSSGWTTMIAGIIATTIRIGVTITTTERRSRKRAFELKTNSAPFGELFFVTKRAVAAAPPVLDPQLTTGGNQPRHIRRR
jgi:hypothetical protein